VAVMSACWPSVSKVIESAWTRFSVDSGAAHSCALVQQKPCAAGVPCATESASETVYCPGQKSPFFGC
jgi:hypothetical protein